MQIKIKKLNPNVKTPVYATDGAGCFDIHAFSCVPLFALTENNVHNFDWHTVVTKEEPCIFGTGLFFEIPKGKVMLIFSRSGHGFNSGVRLANCVGVIDSDYRGELKVKLTNDSDWELNINQGDRIAQAMIVDADQVEFYIVDELTETERGTGGLGSTGVK
jgi:dUTP pyrophosphatase